MSHYSIALITLEAGEIFFRSEILFRFGLLQVVSKRQQVSYRTSSILMLTPGSARTAFEPQPCTGEALMELRSIEGESAISLTEWEAYDIGIKAIIAARDGAFTGASYEVWFFRDAVLAFVQALEHLT